MGTGSNPKNTISWTPPNLTPDLRKNNLAKPKSMSLSDSAMTGPSWGTKAGSSSVGGYSGQKTGGGGMKQMLPQNPFILQGAKPSGGPQLTWQPGSDPQRMQGWNQGQGQPAQQYLDPAANEPYGATNPSTEVGWNSPDAFALLPEEIKAQAAMAGVGMGDLGKFMYDQYRAYWDEQSRQWIQREQDSALWTTTPGYNGELPVEEPVLDGGWGGYGGGGYGGYVPYKSGGGGGGYGSNVNWRIRI